MTDAPGSPAMRWDEGGAGRWERALASSVMECGNSLALISIGKRHDGGTQGSGRQAGRQLK